jgi:hypothetical protein
MTFELGHISVAAGDLADIINEARRIMETADEQGRASRANVQEWNDAVRRLEGFRTAVATILNLSSLESDTHLLDSIRKLTSGKREWQCPVCQEWVLGADLTCPTCTGDHNHTQNPTPEQTDGERTGRFDPVPQPPAPGPDPDLGDWGLALTLPAPAHALVEPPPDTQVISDLLSLVGVTVTADHIRDNWTPGMREQAAYWAGAVHLSASDNDNVVPERPTFLDSPAADAPRCVAHGNEACGLCTLNPAECAAKTDGGDGGCSTYRDTGMHWDTCGHSVHVIDNDGMWHTRNGQVIDPATGAVVGWQMDDVAEEVTNGG